MPRKKKKDLLDHFIESIRKRWETATLRELIYLISYIGAVAVSYQILMKAKGIIVSVFVVGDWFQRLILGPPPGEVPETLDPGVLLTSFAAAYIILKIDADDITSAVAKLTSAAEGLI